MPSIIQETEVIYPDSDGEPLGETGIHVRSLLHLLSQLDRHFSTIHDVYIAMNQFWYYEQGNPAANVSPDIMVILGVPRLPERRSFRSWQELNTPTLVFEFSSESTVNRDLDVKRRIYEREGVLEYYLFDPLSELLNPVLQGFQLVNGAYQNMVENGDGQLVSRFGFRLEVQNHYLRLIDSLTNLPIFSDRELAQVRDQEVQTERLRAEQAELREARERQRAQAEGQKAEAERQRTEAERQRADASERELIQLRAELARLRGQSATETT
jgi:Uma2 family endonuclease